MFFEKDPAVSWDAGRPCGIRGTGIPNLLVGVVCHALTRFLQTGDIDPVNIKGWIVVEPGRIPSGFIRPKFRRCLRTRIVPGFVAHVIGKEGNTSHGHIQGQEKLLIKGCTLGGGSFPRIVPMTRIPSTTFKKGLIGPVHLQDPIAILIHIGIQARIGPDQPKGVKGLRKVGSISECVGRSGHVVFVLKIVQSPMQHTENGIDATVGRIASRIAR